MIPLRILNALVWGLRGDVDMVRQHLVDHVTAARRDRPHHESAAFLESMADEAALEDLLGWVRCPACGRGVPPSELCQERPCAHARKLQAREAPG